jgi:hypothetical protein
MNRIFFLLFCLISLIGYGQDIKCDTLILKSGKEQAGIISEIRQDEIAYRKCNNPEGATHVIDKADVLVILHSNGTREVLNTETVEKKKERKSSIKRRSDFSFSLRRGYWNYERGWYNYNVSFYNLNGIGVSAKMATTWFVYDNKTKYKLGINANWFELGGDYFKGQYINSTGTYDAENSILFAYPLNIGFTNSIKIGNEKSLELNINSGANVIINGLFDNNHDIMFGINPEIRFLSKRHVFAVDYHYTPEISFDSGLKDYKFGFFALSYGFILKGNQ